METGPRTHRHLRVVAAAAATLLLLAATPALAQRAELQVDQEAYAGLPFNVVVGAVGFEPSPEPPPPELDIAGATVTYLGVSPNIQSFTSNINGRITRQQNVTFVYRYRVQASTPGRYEIPPVLVEQNGAKAVTRGATVVVRDIAATDEMKIALELPERPVWIGETFTAHLDWFLRRDVEDQHLAVPLFAMEDAFHVQAPPSTDRQVLLFEAGARELELPFEKSAVTIEGQSYTRFRFRAEVTPTRAGSIDVPPAVAVAQLRVGVGRDRFGFRVPQTRLFKATGQAQRLEVKPLPLQNRPKSFAGAVGTAFSISAQADRTVVAVGEPISLELLVRGDAPMEGLSLPDLDEGGGLDPAKFQVADEAITGELAPEQNGKRFQVTIRLQDADVREIPPIELSYFDPTAAAYRTAKSEPIALSVKGSAVVGASQVESTSTERAAAPTAPASLVDAELSLSPSARTLAGVWTMRQAWPIAAMLYVLGMLVLALRLWQVRTRETRDEKSELRQARRRVLQRIAEARSQPARQAAGPLAAALAQLARLEGKSPAALLARIETAGYSPTAADEPLAPELLDEAAAFSKRRASNTPVGTIAVVLVVALGAASGSARANTLESARSTYENALTTPERGARTSAFAAAEAQFAELVAAHPHSPELLVDWGNAALGAGDLGTATLAYRRALALQPTNARAQQNLRWLRSRSASWLPTTPTSGAIESLFFWHDLLSTAQKHLLAAIAFVLGAVLLAPWGPPRQRRVWRGLAVIPALVWLGLLGSALLEHDLTADAVVTRDDVVLRAADSEGAPAAIQTPLPAGAEVSVREHRGSWKRVALANGAAGWVPAAAVTSVATR